MIEKVDLISGNGTLGIQGKLPSRPVRLLRTLGLFCLSLLLLCH
jgi:hypothetical protein